MQSELPCSSFGWDVAQHALVDGSHETVLGSASAHAQYLWADPLAFSKNLSEDVAEPRLADQPRLVDGQTPTAPAQPSRRSGCP